jgi:hypothetical protein
MCRVCLGKVAKARVIANGRVIASGEPTVRRVGEIKSFLDNEPVQRVFESYSGLLEGWGVSSLGGRGAG